MFVLPFDELQRRKDRNIDNIFWGTKTRNASDICTWLNNRIINLFKSRTITYIRV